MGAAITLLVILSVSVFVIRAAAVALRLTGMPIETARFQARSAFTGTGFTTSESEAIVNYPIRRRVISLLMLFGNIGLASILATFIVSLVSTNNSMAAMSQQLFWLLGAVGLLWFIALNPLADRFMCGAIGWLLRKTTSLGHQGPVILLQIANGFSVAEHFISSENHHDGMTLSDLYSGLPAVTVLGIERGDGSYLSVPELQIKLKPGDRVVLYGSDTQHAALG